MLEQELARLLDGFQAEVLELLTRAINVAFEQALAPSSVGKDARPLSKAPKQQHSERPTPRRRRARRPKAMQIAAGQEIQVLSTDNKNETSDATSSIEPSPSRPRRSPKGPSRDEIDRLVQAGLAIRNSTANSPST